MPKKKLEKARNSLKPLIFSVSFVVLVMIHAIVDIFFFPTMPMIPIPGMNTMYKDNPDFLQKYIFMNPEIRLNTYPRRNLFRMPKPEGVFRIFVVGGSTAQGFPYESRHSWSGMIEAALDNLGHWKDVEVINLGFSALSSGYVADVAPKLLLYDPDFILVYTGHNEYYGVPSEITGGQHWRQRLGYALYEWSVFRWFRDWITPVASSDKNLMTEQFLDQEFPLDSERDQRVATKFLENVQSASRVWNEVPHLFISPVSNLLDMPPFRGLEATPLDFALNRENFDQIVAHLAKLRALPNFNESSLDEYLRGIFEHDADTKWARLTAAKNMDRVPFRARSVIMEALRNSRVPLLDLEEKWREKMGVTFFSNLMFADHLHFNFAGQRAKALEVLLKVAATSGLPEVDAARLQDFIANDDELISKLFLREEAGLQAEAYIISLLNQSPFKEMLLPYIPRRVSFFPNGVIPPDEKTSWFFQNLEKRDFPVGWVNFYQERDSLFQAQEILKMTQFLFPGDYRFHLNRAVLLDRMYYPLSIKYYALAFLLTGDDKIERQGKNASMTYFRNLQGWGQTLEILRNMENPWENIDDDSGEWLSFPR